MHRKIEKVTEKRALIIFYKYILITQDMKLVMTTSIHIEFLILFWLTFKMRKRITHVHMYIQYVHMCIYT